MLPAVFRRYILRKRTTYIDVTPCVHVVPFLTSVVVKVIIQLGHTEPLQFTLHVFEAYVNIVHTRVDSLYFKGPAIKYVPLLHRIAYCHFSCNTCITGSI